MLKTLRNLLEDARGATAIEYGLVVAIISLAGIVSFSLMGESLITIFDTVSTAIDSTAAIP